MQKNNSKKILKFTNNAISEKIKESLRKHGDRKHETRKQIKQEGII